MYLYIKLIMPQVLESCGNVCIHAFKKTKIDLIFNQKSQIYKN